VQGELGDFRDVVAALEQARGGFVAEVVEWRSCRPRSRQARVKLAPIDLGL
jgi:hypothetical protein